MSDTLHTAKSERRQRNVVVSVRMTDAEREQIETLAKELGKPVAALLRERALAVNAPVTGRVSGSRATINTGPTSSATLIVRQTDAHAPGIINA